LVGHYAVRLKIAKIFSIWIGFARFREHQMRIARSILAGSIAVTAATITPAFAKNSSLTSHANANAQKVDEAPAAQGCHAYQKAPDGSWVQLSCREVGPAAQTPTRGESLTRAPGEEAH
jgi:hypothetical protein